MPQPEEDSLRWPPAFYHGQRFRETYDRFSLSELVYIYIVRRPRRR